MKRLALAVALLTAFAAGAQNHQHIADSAALIVDRYQEMLAYWHLPQDSMLVVETSISVYGGSDSIVMRRWYAPPQCHRIEVRYHDQLQTAFYGNGLNRFRHYDTLTAQWEDAPLATFYAQLIGYDIRGPLHNWRAANIELTYLGKAKTERGEELHVVQADDPSGYLRYYMFEDSGLLTVIIETDKLSSRPHVSTPAHIDWKCFHEYLPLGRGIIPSLESFMRDGSVTLLRSSARIAPKDNRLFNNDR